MKIITRRENKRVIAIALELRFIYNLFARGFCSYQLLISCII